MGAKTSLVVKDEAIILKHGNSKMMVSEKSFIVEDDSSLFEIEKHGLFVNEKPFNRHVLSNVCFNNSCIKFDCDDRVKLRNSKIYCGDKLYYEYLNKEFVDKRS